MEPSIGLTGKISGNQRYETFKDERWDLFFGARGGYDFARRWTVVGRGDIGGFGIGNSSRFTWQLELTVGFRALRRLAILAGVAVALLSSILIVDGVIERGRAAEELVRSEALEIRVPSEAVAAEELAAEFEKQTQRSMARDQRNQRLGWALLISTVIFLTCAKGYQASQQVRQPSLVTIGSTAKAKVAHAAQKRLPLVPSTPADAAIDLGFVGSVIESAGRGREAAIPILQALQNHYRYLPEVALQQVCKLTDIAPSQIVGVASFYSQFRRDPVGRHLVRVCHGTACHVAGIGPIMDELRRQLQIEPDADTDPERRVTIESVNCLGCCSLAPVMMVEDSVAGHLTPTSAWQELEVAEAKS